MDSISEMAGSGGDLHKARRQKAGRPDARPAIDRLPPHALGAEQGVLGCVLLSPNECIDECVQVFGKAGKDVFYDLRHQTIFEVLANMRSENKPIDVITVQQRLKDKQLLEQVGGISYLAQLQEATPSAANLSYYCDIVREKFMLRKTIHTCTDVVGRVYDYEGEVDVLMDRVERDIMSIRESAERKLEMVDIAQVQQKVIGQYEDAFNKKMHFGVQTGYPDLDRLIGGLQPQEMIGIGGTPSAGKTSLALCIIYHMAVKNKIPSGIFSLDDSAETLIHRLACLASRVDGAKVKRGDITEGDMVKLSSAMVEINAAKANLLIDDHGGLDERTMLAKGRRMVQAGAKIIWLDYLQLLMARGDGMYERTTNASHAIKNMAKELNLPVVAISAITKPHDASKNWKPTLFDFRGSGDIDYDLNQAWLLYRDPEDENEFAPAYKVYLDVAKNKQGPTGRIGLEFLKYCTRFESLSPISASDVPQ